MFIKAVNRKIEDHLPETDFSICSWSYLSPLKIYPKNDPVGFTLYEIQEAQIISRGFYLLDVFTVKLA